jgi:hypothetical protein
VEVFMFEIVRFIDIGLALAFLYFTLALVSGLFAFKHAENTGNDLRKKGSRVNLLLAQFAEVSGSAVAIVTECKKNQIGPGDLSKAQEGVITKLAIARLRRSDLYGFLAVLVVLFPVGLAFNTYAFLITFLANKAIHSAAYEYLVPLVMEHRNYLKVRL